MDDFGRTSPDDGGGDRSVVAFPRAGHVRAVTFDRRDLSQILDVYGRMVAAGEWRDYAIDHLVDRAVFSVFRHTAEAALWRIEKAPKNAARQGMWSVTDTGGRIVKRGPDLGRVLAVFDKKPRLIDP